MEFSRVPGRDSLPELVVVGEALAGGRGGVADLELLGTLGEGGMGLVRLARQVALQRGGAHRRRRELQQMDRLHRGAAARGPDTRGAVAVSLAPESHLQVFQVVHILGPLVAVIALTPLVRAESAEAART